MTSLGSDHHGNDGNDDELIGALVYQSSQTAKVRASQSDVDDARANTSVITSEEESVIGPSIFCSPDVERHQLQRQLTVDNKEARTKASTTISKTCKCEIVWGEECPNLRPKEYYQLANERLLLELEKVKKENECLRVEMQALVRKERIVVTAMAEAIAKFGTTAASPPAVFVTAAAQPSSHISPNQVDISLLHPERQEYRHQQKGQRHNLSLPKSRPLPEMEHMIEAKHLEEMKAGSCTHAVNGIAGQKRKYSPPKSEEVGTSQTSSVNDNDDNTSELNRSRIRGIVCWRDECVIYAMRGQACPHHYIKKNGATETKNTRPAEESIAILDNKAGATTMVNDQLPPAKNDYPFLQNLVKILKDETNQDIIEWSNNLRGTVRVHNPKRLEDEVLGCYFCSSNYKTFHRQMNYFGFKVVRNAMIGCHRMGSCDFFNQNIDSGDVECILLLKKKCMPRKRRPKRSFI